MGTYVCAANELGVTLPSRDIVLCIASIGIEYNIMPQNVSNVDKRE